MKQIDPAKQYYLLYLLARRNRINCGNSHDDLDRLNDMIAIEVTKLFGPALEEADHVVLPL